ARNPRRTSGGCAMARASLVRRGRHRSRYVPVSRRGNRAGPALRVRSDESSSRDTHRARRDSHGRGKLRMIRHRYVILLLAAIAWATSIAVYLLGKKWLLFGAGAAALVIGIHMVLVVIAFVLGGASLVGFLLGWIHAHPSETPGSGSKLIHWA